MLARVRGESAFHAVRVFTVPILVFAYDGGAIAVIAPAPDGGVRRVRWVRRLTRA